jgi:hypothetical protein
MRRPLPGAPAKVGYVGLVLAAIGIAAAVASGIAGDWLGVLFGGFIAVGGGLLYVAAARAPGRSG